MCNKGICNCGLSSFFYLGMWFLEKKNNKQTTSKQELNNQIHASDNSKILAYTSDITTGLQTRGIDLANASDQIKLVIGILSRVRQDVETYHHICYDEACRIALTDQEYVENRCTDKMLYS